MRRFSTWICSLRHIYIYSIIYMSILSETYVHTCEGFRRGSAGDQRHEGGRPICWRELGGACSCMHSRRVLACTLGVQEGGRPTLWRGLGTHARTRPRANAHAPMRTRKYTHANTHTRTAPACRYMGCQSESGSLLHSHPVPPPKNRSK